MGVRCISSIKAMRDYEYLNDNARNEVEGALAQYAHTVGKVAAIFHGENPDEVGNDVFSATGSDKYVQQALREIMMLDAEQAGGKNLWKAVRDASPEQRESVIRGLDMHLMQMYKLSDDPEGVRRLALDSCRAQSIIEQTAAQMKSSNWLNSRTRKFFDSIGLKGFSFHENKIAAIHHHPVASRLFMALNEIETYTERHGKGHISEVAKLFKNASKMSVFKYNDIGVKELSAMMKYFKDKDIYNDTPNASEFVTWAIENNYMEDHDLDDSQQSALYGSVTKLVEAWHTLNYGLDDSGKIANATVSDKTDGDIKYFKHTTGVIGYYNNLSNKFFDMYSEYKAKLSEYRAKVGEFTPSDSDNAIEALFSRLQGHNYRKWYVPMSSTPELLTEAPEGVKSDPMMSWLFPQTDDDVDSPVDFLKNVKSNIAMTNMVMKKMGNMITARTLEMYMGIESTKNVSWFDDEGRQDIKLAVTSLIDDLNLMANYDSTRQTIGARVVKSIGNIPQLFVGSYVFFPGSSLNNVIGFSTGLALRLGKDMKTGEFKQAFSDDSNVHHSTAKFIDNYVEKWLVGSGMPHKYMDVSDVTKGGEDGGDFIDRVNSFVGAIGNHLADGGVLGKFSHSYKQVATLAGSEESGRQRHTKAYIFNRVVGALRVAELGTEGMLTDEHRERIIMRETQEAWYEVTEAMGLFSPLNKNFMLHNRANTAETAPAAFAGMMLKVWNAFRHVSVSGFDNFVKAGIDMSYEAKREGYYTMAKEHLSAVGSAAVAGTVMMMAYELLKKHDTPTFSPLGATLPIDTPLQGVRMLYTQAKVLSGGNVSEQEYEEAMSDGLNFLVGAAGGRYASDFYSRGAENMLAFENNPFTATADIVTNYKLAGYKDSIYKERQKLRDSWGFLLASDPLFVGERALELLAIEHTNPAYTQQHRMEVLKGMVTTMTGLSLYSRPVFVKKSYRQEKKHYDNIVHRAYLSSGRTRRPYMKNLYSKDVTDRAAYMMKNYGFMPKR